MYKCEGRRKTLLCEDDERAVPPEEVCMTSLPYIDIHVQIEAWRNSNRNDCKIASETADR
jgi:hypothetical protein